MKKILGLLLLSVSFLLASINLQTASKEELMGIKGIGPKKADQIIKYRKTNTINSADDLKNIKGFGDGIVKNVKENKTVSKIKMKEKNKKAKIEDKRKEKIQKAKEKGLSEEELKQRKEKINANAKKRKQKANEKTKKKREKRKAKKEEKNKS